MSAVRRPPHTRSGCQLARLNRGVKLRNRAEVLDALVFPLAILLALAVWIGVCAIVGR